MSAKIISDPGTQCQKSRKIPQSLGRRTKSDDLSAEIWQSTAGNRGLAPDMRFVKKFTPPDFQAKNFTPLISPNFNSFGDKNTKKNE